MKTELEERFEKIKKIIQIKQNACLQEAQILTKSRKPINKLHKLGPSLIVITNKNNLIQASDGKKIYKLKPNKIKVVERTGAGDAFASTFVACILKNKPIPAALKLALKNSESVIKHFGAKNNLLRIKLK